MTSGITNVESGEPTTIQCRNCRAVWDIYLNFCGKCGQRLRGNSVTTNNEVLIPSSPAAPKKQTTSRRRGYFLTILLSCSLVAVLISGVLFSTRLFAAKPGFASSTLSAKPISPLPQGIAWFYNVHGLGDGVGLRIRSLPTLKKGYVYVGWLINPRRPDVSFPIKPLLLLPHGSVLFKSEYYSSFNSRVQDLRLMFTQVIVTAEPMNSPLKGPAGRTILQGNINADALASLSQLFVSADYMPDHSALLSGLRSQLGELERWVANMLDSQQVNDVESVHADLLRLIYSIEGTSGVDIPRLNVLALSNITNEGDGFGLLSSQATCQISAHTCGYLDALRITLQSLVTTGALSSDTMRRLTVTRTNMEQLTRTLRQQILDLVSFSTLDASTQTALKKLSTVSDVLLNGIDHDGDGSIDPVAGEAAAAQLYAYMQQVGAIKLA